MRQRGSILFALALFALVAPTELASGDSFFTLDPCRVIDTRSPGTGGPALLPGETAIFQLAGNCGIPSNAKEVAINITAVAPAAGGSAVAFAGDASAPSTTTIAFNAGQTRASNAIVQLAANGSGTMALLNASGGSTNFVIDVSGYFLCPAITVNPTNPTLPAGTEGSSYSQTFTATGGSGTDTFAITAGALPAGLNLSSGGVLSGTPTVAGDFSFTVTATDTATNCTASQAYTLHLACGTLAVAISPTPAQVCTSSAGNGASATAGFSSYSWLITNGTIVGPANTQSITYTAGASGNVGLTVNVTDASACPGQATLNVPIVANPSPPTITTSNPQTFTVSGSSGTFTLTFSGATTSALAFNATAADVQTALNALSTIGGAGGSVAVTLAGGFFTVTFGGALTGPQPQLTALGSGGATVVVDSPAVCADSTGNMARGPAGATTYAWTITNGTITSLTNIQTITYTAGSSGTVGLGLTITNGASCSASNSASLPINANPATPTIAASNPQTFTVSGTSGTFTLTFSGQTTGPLAFDATAAAVQTALNALSSIGGVGGTAAVTQALNVYTVTFGGTLTGPQPQLTAAGAGGATVVVDPPSVCADLTGNQASGPAGATTYVWSITNGTITSATGVQTITYTAGPSGNVGLTLTVTNASHCSASNSLNVAINPSPATPTINPTPAQVCANSTGNTADGPPGATTYAWSITNGTITLGATSQTVTYTANASGNVGLTLTVTNAQGCSAQNSLNVPINPIPAFTPAAGALATATFNVAYSLTFSGTGGTAPYTFVLAGGALPTGMTLNADGSVSPNTPSATGHFAFSIKVTDAHNCSSATQAYTLDVQPNLGTDAYSGVGNTQLFITGVSGAPTTPAVSSATTVLANDTPAGIAVTAGTTACGGIGGSITMDTTGHFIYTPPVSTTGLATCTYTGTSNTIAATGAINITLSNRVWYVDNATASGTNDGRSNTPFTTMTAVNGAATNNGDFIYVAKGSGSTTGAYTMKTSQQLIGAGATLNVPTVSPILTVAGLAANTPTLSGTLTLASSVTVNGIDMSTGSSNAITGTSVTGINVTARDVTTTTGTAVNISGAGNSGTMSFTQINANGAVNGIVIQNYNGSFTVTGDGGSSSNGSGGTIQATTGHSISLANVSGTGVTLGYLNIVNPGATGVQAAPVGWVFGTNPSGLGVNNFTLNHCTISDAAGDVTKDDGVRLENATGNVTITNSSIAGARHQGITIDNFSQNIATMTIQSNTVSGTPGGDGVLIQMRGTSVMTTGTIGGATAALGNTITSNSATGLQVANADTGNILSLNVQNNTVSGNNAGIDLDLGQSSSLTATVQNNTLTGQHTQVINMVQSTSSTAGTLTVTVKNNTIGTAGVFDSGSQIGSGIRVANGAVNVLVTIDSNAIREVSNASGIELGAQAYSVNGNVKYKVVNNTITRPTGSSLAVCGGPPAPCPASQVFVLSDSNGLGGFDHVCTTISGNTVYDPTSWPNGAGQSAFYFARRTSASNTLQLEGTLADARAQILATNTITNPGPSPSSSDVIDENTSGTVTIVAAGTCGAFP